MANPEFDNFVEIENKSLQEPEIDWSAQLEEWLKYIDSLYDQVCESLREHIDTGAIKVEYTNIEISEENIGTYSTRAMSLAIGRKKVTFSPIGTLLIGTKGRVDMEGPYGTVKFILADKAAIKPRIHVSIKFRDGNKSDQGEKKVESSPIDWTWKIVSPNPSMHFEDLTNANLTEAIMNVCNG